jgi:hypothetical protein
VVSPDHQLKEKPTMARKKKEASEQPADEGVVKLISASKLKSALNSALKAKEDCSEITGALGEEIKTLIEKNHLNRKAFNIIKSLYGLSPEKLRETWDHTLYYFEASGLEKKADSAPRLPMNDDVGGVEDEDTNVHPLRAAAE